MDDSEIESSTESTTLEERLDALCIYYMSMGVPYEEFWYGDYTKLKYYEEAYLKKRKIQNENAWMQGIYFYSGVATALTNAFRDKGRSAEPYLEKPIDFFPKTAMEQKAEEEQLKRKIIAQLSAWADDWKKKNGNARN